MGTLFNNSGISCKTKREIRLIFLTVLLAFTTVLALHINSGIIVSTLLSSQFSTQVNVEGASLTFPSTIEIKGLYIQGKGCEKPVLLNEGSIGFSPLSYLFGGPLVSDVELNESTIEILGNNDGKFEIAGSSQAKMLLTILSTLSPAKAVIKHMNVRINAPMLPGQRSLSGPLKLIKAKEHYRLSGMMVENELLLKARGTVFPKESNGSIDITLETRGCETSIASTSTGNTKAAFRYDTSLFLQSSGECLTIQARNGKTLLKPLSFSVPFMGGKEVRCTHAVLSENGHLRIENALLSIDGISFEYSGPMKPSMENKGKIKLKETLLSRVIALKNNAYALPGILSASKVYGTFTIDSPEMKTLEGDVNVIIPQDDGNQVPIETAMAGKVLISDGEISLKNGMISGVALSDNWRGRIDFHSMKAHIQVSDLFTNSRILQRIYPNQFTKEVNANIIAAANIEVPLLDPTKLKGRFGLELTKRNASQPIYPFEEKTGISLIPESMKTVFDISENGIEVRKGQILGQNFSYGDFRGSCSFEGKDMTADVVIAGVSEKVTGFNGLTGSISSTKDSDSISFTLLCRENSSITCSPQGGSSHLLTYKKGDLTVSAAGTLSMKNIIEKKLPQNSLYTLSLNRNDVTFKGKGTIESEDSALHVNIKEGVVRTGFLEGSLIQKCNLVICGEEVSLSNLVLASIDGGTVSASAKMRKDKLTSGSAQCSNFLVISENLPSVRLSGSLWYDRRKDSTYPSIHSALVATPENPAIGLKAITFLGDYEDSILKISKMRLRTKEGFLSANGTLPLEISHNLESKIGTGKCQVTIESDTFNLNHLKYIVPETSNMSGFIDGIIEISGTTGHPSLNGCFSARDTSFEVSKDLGRISEISFDGKLSEDTLTLRQLKGNWNTGVRFSNDVTTFSSISFSPEFSAHLKSQNTNITKDGIRLQGISFKGNFARNTGLTGTFNGDKIMYRATGSSANTEAALEEYLISARPILEPSFPLNITVDIPKAIHIRNSSIDSEFGGTVHIEKEREGHSSCSGKFDLLRGNFYFQGQRFKLERGHITLKRDPGMEINGTPLPLPLPEMYIKGEGNISGISVNMSLVGNPLIKNGMHATIDSEKTNHTEGEIFSLFTEKKTYSESLAPTILNELGYQLFASPFEDALGKVLPFDTVRLGANISLEDNYTPTILMGKYLGNELHINIEGEAGSDNDFWKEFAIDFTPEGSNMKLSFARELSGTDEGHTTMAFDYSVRF